MSFDFAKLHKITITIVRHSICKRAPPLWISDISNGIETSEQKFGQSVCIVHTNTASKLQEVETTRIFL